jgi:hypothetical protein
MYSYILPAAPYISSDYKFRPQLVVHSLLPGKTVGADLSALVAADVVMAFPFTRSSTATGILPVEAPGEATLGQPGDEVSGSLFSWDFLEFRK